MTYAAGVAACASERWDLAARLLTEPRTEPHNGSAILPVSLALRPDNVGLPDGAKHINQLLWPLFTDHLGIDTASFVDAWERFEYLHHLVWSDACLRQLDGVNGTPLGWRPHLRIEGIGPVENRATADLWFESVILATDHPLVADGWLLAQDNAVNARLEFQKALANHAQRADDALILPRGGGFLPSGRHYPGRYDDDPRPPA